MLMLFDRRTLTFVLVLSYHVHKVMTPILIGCTMYAHTTKKISHTFTQMHSKAFVSMSVLHLFPSATDRYTKVARSVHKG